MAVILHPHGPQRLKLGAIGALIVPIVVLAIFTIGETAGGDWSGLQHAVEIVPLLLILAAAWRYPYAAGIVLLGLGALVFAVWLGFAVMNLHPVAIVLTAALLFAPPIVAGWLLIRAGQAVR